MLTISVCICRVHACPMAWTHGNKGQHCGYIGHLYPRGQPPCLKVVAEVPSIFHLHCDSCSAPARPCSIWFRTRQGFEGILIRFWFIGVEAKLMSVTRTVISGRIPEASVVLPPSLCGSCLALLLLWWLPRLWLLVWLLGFVRLLLCHCHRRPLRGRLHSARLLLHGCRLGARLLCACNHASLC